MFSLLPPQLRILAVLCREKNLKVRVKRKEWARLEISPCTAGVRCSDYVMAGVVLGGLEGLGWKGNISRHKTWAGHLSKAVKLS